jgi:hypothetical protein
MEQGRTKRQFLEEWIQAVDTHGSFGTWGVRRVFQPADIGEFITARAFEGGQTLADRAVLRVK